MKHLATIQAEFLKVARRWDELSLEFQREYLRRHPKSKRRLTARPEGGRPGLEHHPFIKKLLKKKVENDGTYTVDERIPRKRFRRLLKSLVEHYGKPNFKSSSKVKTSLPFTSKRDRAFSWETGDHSIITLWRPQRRDRHTTLAMQTPEHRALAISDEKLLKDMKTYDFDMSHDSPMQMVRKITTLYKKYPDELFSIGEGPMGGFDEDNLTLARLPTKEYRDAMERTDEWGPRVSPVSKGWLRGLRDIAEERAEERREDRYRFGR